MPPSASADTPEFLVWALGYACPIRGFQDGSDPERTERQLRAARAVSDARRQGRVLEGICVDPPNGFQIDDALALYGGLPIVEQTCGPCPANAAARLAPGALAGCFGILPVSSESQIATAVDREIARLDLTAEYTRLFPPTQPGWYGLWMRSPLEREQLSFVTKFFAALDTTEADGASIRELLAGLHAAIEANLPFHAILFPRGRVEGTSWRLVPHCPRCKAAWSAAGSRCCAVCGHDGHLPPEKKRKARGQRPYFPLGRLLGEQAAADFLVRYAAFRKQPESIPPAQIPPRGGPPNSPPAD